MISSNLNTFIWALRPNWMWKCRAYVHWNVIHKAKATPFQHETSIQLMLTFKHINETHTCFCVRRNNYFNLKCKVTPIIFVATQQIIIYTAHNVCVCVMWWILTYHRSWVFNSIDEGELAENCNSIRLNARHHSPNYQKIKLNRCAFVNITTNIIYLFIQFKQS